MKERKYNFNALYKKSDTLIRDVMLSLFRREIEGRHYRNVIKDGKIVKEGKTLIKIIDDDKFDNKWTLNIVSNGIVYIHDNYHRGLDIKEIFQNPNKNITNA